MPKVELNYEAFKKSLGKNYSLSELEKHLSIAKAEIDDYQENEGVLKVELNDTNRPDLWSRVGLVRQLKSYWQKESFSYSFFSTKENPMDSQERVIKVQKGLENIRPFIAGFVAQGKEIDKILLNELIQIQEKLTWNYGQKRKAIAMGIYRSKSIKYPISYQACDPKTTSFIPLGEDKHYTFSQVLEHLPKGKEFGHLLKDKPFHPVLKDSKGEILSYPPILNSQFLGCVEEGDSDIFIELTGTFLESLLLVTSIVACDLSDLGFEIKPVKVEYPDKSSYTTPLYFQKKRTLSLDSLKKITGEDFSVADVEQSLFRMGIECLDWENPKVCEVSPPVYRNDFLHEVDLIEDIVIGYGLNRFKSQEISSYTQGGLTQAEETSRLVKNLMVGMGFQEMLYNYLGSKENFIEKMQQNEKNFILIANPMTENYAVLRNSILPNLLMSESISAHAVYPHNIFEVGKIVVRTDKDPTGSSTKNSLAWLTSGEEANFSHIYAQLSAFFYYLNLEWQLQEREDIRFLKGRSGVITSQGEELGFMGEVHPQILTNYGITSPCVVAEIVLDNLSILLEKERSK